jgi:hypothetical protein
MGSAVEKPGERMENLLQPVGLTDRNTNPSPTRGTPLSANHVGGVGTESEDPLYTTSIGAIRRHFDIYKYRYDSLSGIQRFRRRFRQQSAHGTLYTAQT